MRKPHIKGFTPPKFLCDDPALLAYLEEHGYAVVREAASRQQVAKAHDDFWQYSGSSKNRRSACA